MTVLDSTKTMTELIAAALDELMVVGTGQSAADEDIDKARSRVDGLFAELSSRDVVTVGDPDEIPVEFCGALTELIANEISPLFGRPKLPSQERAAIEDRLRVTVQRQPAPSRYLTTDMGGPAVFTATRWRSGG